MHSKCLLDIKGNTWFCRVTMNKKTSEAPVTLLSVTLLIYQHHLWRANIFSTKATTTLIYFQSYFWQHLGHTEIHFAHLCSFFETRGALLPQGILFLMQQGNPHLAHNDGSSPTGSLALEYPFIKPCVRYYKSVRVYVCVCVNSYATAACPHFVPPLAIHKELLQATEFAIFTCDACSGELSFYFGRVACERDSYCYCDEGLLSVNPDLLGLHGIVIQLCQHGVCWVGVTTFLHFTASLDVFQVTPYHKLSLCCHFVQ